MRQRLKRIDVTPAAKVDVVRLVDAMRTQPITTFRSVASVTGINPWPHGSRSFDLGVLTRLNDYFDSENVHSVVPSEMKLPLYFARMRYSSDTRRPPMILCDGIGLTVFRR